MNHQALLVRDAKTVCRSCEQLDTMLPEAAGKVVQQIPTCSQVQLNKQFQFNFSSTSVQLQFNFSSTSVQLQFCTVP
jgi:hypothetical protein